MHVDTNWSHLIYRYPYERQDRAMIYPGSSVADFLGHNPASVASLWPKKSAT